MTLVIVGHEFEKNIDYLLFEEGVDPNRKVGMHAAGLFAVADSSITMPASNGVKTILGEFRKIYSIPIKVWKPSFTGLYFNKYVEVYYEAECFIAIAGSTLTAQHVLNLIIEHLGNIRISYKRSRSYLTPGEYVLIRHCQDNLLQATQGVDQWGEDMFTPANYVDLVTASDILKIIEYSINEALSSAGKYKIDQQSLNAMYSEFAAGVFCPKEENYHLHIFRTANRVDAQGLIEVYATNEVVAEGNIAALGMRNEFEAAAQEIMNASIKSETSPSKKLFDFLNEAIDQVKERGSFAIDRPSICKNLTQGRLKKTHFQR